MNVSRRSKKSSTTPEGLGPVNPDGVPGVIDVGQAAVGCLGLPDSPGLT